MEMVSSRTCVLEGGVDGVASPEESQGLMNPAPPSPVPRRVCARWSGRGRGAGGCEGRGRVVERLGRRARDAGERTAFAGRELACGGLDGEGDGRPESATRPEILPAVRVGLAGDTTAPTDMST